VVPHHFISPALYFCFCTSCGLVVMPKVASSAPCSFSSVVTSQGAVKLLFGRSKACVVVWIFEAV
jgi:hypothetical protein